MMGKRLRPIEQFKCPPELFESLGKGKGADQGIKKEGGFMGLPLLGGDV
jgi:hypothetical protein